MFQPYLLPNNELPRAFPTACLRSLVLLRQRRQKCCGHFRLFLHLVVTVVFLFATTGMATAQKSSRQGDGGVGAETLIARAQKTLETKEASLVPLKTLREELANLRDSSKAIVDQGSIEARTIRAKLDSIGLPPAEGGIESDKIANRRAELLDELGKAEEPIRLANEVLQQSEVLISEFDQRIRAQQALVLLHRFPTPLSPKVWLTAIQELTVYTGIILEEIKETLQEPGEIARLQGNLPTMLVLGIFGLAVLLVGRPLVLRHLENAAAASRTRWYRWALLALKNFSRLALPAIGLAALLLIIKLLQIHPPTILAITEALPFMAIIVVVASWLGHTIFSPTKREERLLSLTDDHARTGFRLCLGLGVVLALELLVQVMVQNHLFAEATISVLAAPLILCSCLLLWRMGRIFRSDGDRKTERPEEADGDDEKPTLDSGFLYMLSKVMQAAALIVPFFVLLGFIKLSQKSVDSIVLTVVLLGLALFLYNIVLSILQAVLLSGLAEEQEKLSLLPVCIICLLVIAFAPLLAIAWGASIADLREVWRLLTDGIQLGEIRLSLDMVMTLVILFTIGVFLTRWLQRLLRLSVLPRTKLDRGAQTALITGVGYIGLTLAVLVAVSSAGLNLSNLAVVAGALSVGIGFGLQTIVSNFVSGIILLVERPIKEGDWIEVSGYSGVVRKISVRSTRIETFDRHDVVLPNSDLISGTVKNMTLSSLTGRLTIPVGVAYGSDIEKTREILLNVGRSHKGVCAVPPPSVLFTGLGDSSLDFELRCILQDIGEIVTVKSDLLFAIYTEFNRQGIEIPFPQRDIHLRDIDQLVDAIKGRSERLPEEMRGGVDQGNGSGSKVQEGENSEQRKGRSPIAGRE